MQHTDRHIDRAEFRRLMHSTFVDNLHLFEPRLASRDSGGSGKWGSDSLSSVLDAHATQQATVHADGAVAEHDGGDGDAASWENAGLEMPEHAGSGI